MERTLLTMQKTTWRQEIHNHTRLIPSHAFLSRSKSSIGDLHSPAEKYTDAKVFLELELTLTLAARNIAHVQVKTA